MTAVLEGVTAADAPELDALVARCSPRTRYTRFVAPVRALPAAYRAGVLAGDPAHHDALAVRSHSTEIVGLASLVAGTEYAELGILVEDSWQRRGLGTALVHALVARARQRRVPYLGATVLPASSGLLVWLGRMLPLERSARDAYGLSAVYRLL